MFHSFMLSLCSNTLTLESIFEYIRQKLIKNMLILKFHPGMKCLHVFFSFFHPGMKSHSCLSSRDEISSRQKRVNSQRHRITIDRDDFIPGWNFTCKHPLRQNICRIFHILAQLLLWCYVLQRPNFTNDLGLISV